MLSIKILKHISYFMAMSGQFTYNSDTNYYTIDTTNIGAIKLYFESKTPNLGGGYIQFFEQAYFNNAVYESSNLAKLTLSDCTAVGNIPDQKGKLIPIKIEGGARKIYMQVVGNTTAPNFTFDISLGISLDVVSKVIEVQNV